MLGDVRAADPDVFTVGIGECLANGAFDPIRNKGEGGRIGPFGGDGVGHNKYVDAYRMFAAPRIGDIEDPTARHNCASGLHQLFEMIHCLFGNLEVKFVVAIGQFEVGVPREHPREYAVDIIARPGDIAVQRH